MPANAEVIYKDRDAIVAELVAGLQARFPDANLTPDTVFRIWIEVMASTVEGLFLAWQLLHDDMFIQTANGVALLRYGEMFGRPLKAGTLATGSVQFVGQGGVAIPVNTQVAAPQAAEEALTFSVTVSGTIPNPGIPAAPALSDAGAGSLVAGTYQYGVTFQTAGGESALGAVSGPLTIAASHNINVTSIPLGGPGTTARNLYQSVDGGSFQKITNAAVVAALNNNSTTSATIGTSTLGSAPPAESTAERLTVPVQADDTGIDYNVGIGTVTEFVNTIAGLTSVTNLAAMTGGTDDEDLEEFRSQLLQWVRAPKSGSDLDLKAWAEAIPGVETATVFANDNLGTPTNGHVTVRISGPGGSVPDASVQAAVATELDSKDLANIIIHVTTFTPVAVAVTVDVTTSGTYTLADVTAAVTNAITAYINNIQVGGTVYRSGIIDAVFGLAGVSNVTVSVPASDTTMAATQKATPGTITVT
jgi:uncharacterized phage protein gp47/JayE